MCSTNASLPVNTTHARPAQVYSQTQGCQWAARSRCSLRCALASCLSAAACMHSQLARPVYHKELLPTSSCMLSCCCPCTGTKQRKTAARLLRSGSASTPPAHHSRDSRLQAVQRAQRTVLMQHRAASAAAAQVCDAAWSVRCDRLQSPSGLLLSGLC